MQKPIVKATLLILLLVSSSAGAEWVRVGGEDSFDKYIDPAAIRKDGNLRKVWEVIDLKQRREDGGLSFRFRSEYDCKQERSRTLSFTTHTEPMANGISLTQNENSTSWTDTPPGSYSETVQKIVCTK